MAFLSILTRTMPHRRLMLNANIASVHAQSDPDFEQLIECDEAGRGWEYAARMLVDLAQRAVGQYILILDDDDLMVNADGIANMKSAAQSNPSAVIFRGWHGDQLGILPPPDVWGKRPRLGTIGSFDFIIRRDVFGELAETAVSGGYNNDFALISAVFGLELPVVWLDTLICAVMRRSIGK